MIWVIVHPVAGDHCRTLDRMIEKAHPDAIIVRHMHSRSGAHEVTLQSKKESKS